MSTEARTLRQYAELIRAGHRVDLNPNQFNPQTQTDLQKLLEVTRLAGGPLAPTLDRFASVLLVREQANRELELAVAGPKASTRLVMALPILVLLGSGIAGIPIFKSLVTPSIVWVSLTLGGLMFWFGNRWTNKLLAKAEPRTSDPGISLDALAIAIQAGLPLSAAAELVSDVEIHELQEIGRYSGIALTQLLTDRANSLRQEQFNADRLKIQKTSVSVLWPLGLTVLPAFVLIAIVPVSAALLQNQ